MYEGVCGSLDWAGYSKDLSICLAGLFLQLYIHTLYIYIYTCMSVHFRFASVKYVYAFSSIACARWSVNGSGECRGWPRPIRPIDRRSLLDTAILITEKYFCVRRGRDSVSAKANPPVEMPRPFQDKERWPDYGEATYVRGPFGSTRSRDGIPFFQPVAAINVRVCPWPIVRRSTKKNGELYRGINFLIFV